MIRRVLKRGVKLSVAVAKFAADEVKERFDKVDNAPNATEPGLDAEAHMGDPEGVADRPPPPVISATEVDQGLTDETLVLLDCREFHEWEAGYIAPSVHIPMMDLPQRVSELDKTRTTVVYCLHGMRSAEVAAWMMHKEGFDDVRSMDGCIVSWYSDFDQARIVVTRSEDH